ncbi:hypothetical protein [Tateyamaria sp. ANG-S1]|uniref:hypothetical protein n=1 Tax=Tateyamaria sp. ANG-S1 TaxID=1577905 RepID=UPI00057C3EB6|nr:hypothetical protein [Tateyamaria sp. ANG-S1]KIC51049.1 hypothetical protein RA29_03990 [Tateyamaria sp. ANG-S1]
MNNPGKIPWKRIWQINMRFLGSVILLIPGWFCWTNASIASWQLWLFGGILLVGGGVQFVRTSFEAVGLVWGHWSWRRTIGKAAKPKSDPKPVRDTLKDRGIIR